MRRAAACWQGDRDKLAAVYGEGERSRLEPLVSWVPLNEAEVVLTTWGMPRLDAAYLDRAAALRCVFYAAGSVRPFVTAESWQRGVRVVSAWELNAVPVADFTLGVILLSLKRAFALSRAMRENRAVDPEAIAGTYGSRVGLVSLGAVGRLVRERLRPFEVRVAAFDPFLTEEEARCLEVERMELEDLFAVCDVVSIHTPLLPATRGMIDGRLLRRMPPRATLVNTARGAIVREEELIEVLRERADLQAVLDVTDPEPAAPSSPLRSLPNVMLTPHVAGSVGPERRRLGAAMVEEVERYVRGEPLRRELTAERADLLA